MSKIALQLARLPLLLLITISLAAAPLTAQRVTEVAGALPPPPGCTGGHEGCWTNAVRLVDIDGDHDLDVLLANHGAYALPGDMPEPLVVYANDGAGGFTNVSATSVDDFTGNARHVAVGDVTGDGHLDVFVVDAVGDAHTLFVNDGHGVFTDEASARLPSVYVVSGVPRMGDVDGDGDLDIVVAGQTTMHGELVGLVFVNDGAGAFTQKPSAVPLVMLDHGTYPSDLDLADVDGDFDLDFVFSSRTGGPGATLLLNDGTGTFALADEGAIADAVETDYHYAITLCDVDGDGDLDMWRDGAAGAYGEQLLLNDGAGTFTDRTAAQVEQPSPTPDDNGVLCADVDDDGDLDAVVLSMGLPERLLENDGDGFFTAVAGAFPEPNDCTLSGEFGDLNGDGKLDLVTGQGECSNAMKDALYLGNAMMPTDTTAPHIRAVQTPTTARVVRFAVTDSHTTDDGPRLSRAYAVVGATGATTEHEARFVGGDLFRVVLPVTTQPTPFRVCARDLEDNESCSAEQTYEGEDSTEDGGVTEDAGVIDDASVTTDASVGADAGPDGSVDGGGSGGGCATSRAAGNETAGLALIIAAMLVARRTRRRAAA